MARHSLGTRENLRSSVARPEVKNQIAVVQAGKTPERVIVLPEADFDAPKGRVGYRQRANGDLERLERSLVYVILPAAKQPEPDGSRLDNPMGNEYDYKCKGLEFKAVSRWCGY